jgi:uncharacterized RDD family membrane protein YckC
MPYYLHVSGTRKGPVEINEIKRMIETDKLSLLDQVWDKTAKRWTVIRDFPAIAGFFESNDEAAQEYIINVDGKTGGPFPLNMILREIEKGRFLGHHFVWDEKATRWVEAKSHPFFDKYFRRIPERKTMYNLARGGVRIGPVSFAEVERLVGVGELTSDDYVWDFERNRWVTLVEKPDFSELFAIPEVPKPDTTVAPVITDEPPVAEPVPSVKPESPDAVPTEPVAETPIETIPTERTIVPSAPGDIIEIPTTAMPTTEPPVTAFPEEAPVIKPIERAPKKPFVSEPEKVEPIVVEKEEVKVFEPTRPSPVKRIVAQVIDLAFISVSFLAILIVMAVTGMNPLAPSLEQETYRATAFVAFGVIALVYLLFRDGFGGASIGKRIMGLKVVQGYDARPANPLHSIVRNLFLLIPILNIAELFMVINDKEGRRLGDKALGCAEMYSTEAEYIRDHGLEVIY